MSTNIIFNPAGYASFYSQLSTGKDNIHQMPAEPVSRWDTFSLAHMCIRGFFLGNNGQKLTIMHDSNTNRYVPAAVEIGCGTNILLNMHMLFL